MRGGAIGGISTVPVPRIGNPGVTLSAPATSPLQAQVQDNYAAQLRAEQSQLQQQSSGLTRREININGLLNGFTPRGGLADKYHIRLVFDESGNAFAQQRVVVNAEDADACGGAHGS